MRNLYLEAGNEIPVNKNLSCSVTERGIQFLINGTNMSAYLQIDSHPHLWVSV